MSQIAPPPNPSLLAIILIIQSRAGPRFAFHYPPDPLTTIASLSPQHNHRQHTSAERDSSSDSEEASDSASDTQKPTTVRGRTKAKAFNDEVGSLSSGVRKAKATDEEEGDSSSPDSTNPDATWRVPWETFLSMSTVGLEKLLSPNTRTWHKRRFEVGVNELCFVGWPVFIRDDGTWQKRKRRSRTRGDIVSSSVTSPGHHDSPSQAASEAHGGDTTADTSASGPSTLNPKSAPGSSSTPKSAHTDELTMFNVVFVMNPPVLEYSLRVREMYDNVVKKLGRALKWEQARVDYVWKEAQTIMNLREKARESRR